MIIKLRSTNKKISRKSFFKWAGVAALVPLSKIWHDSVESKQAFSKRTLEIILSHSLPDGIHFYKEVILKKEGVNFQLFSSKCTHLGCRINKMENDQLLCPCHGSKYNLNGEPVVGPAVQPLRQIDFQTIVSEEKLTISYKL